MPCDKKENLKSCPCTYTDCDKRGLCCACVRFHRQRNELPGCFFSPKEEKTYDRSIDFFIECYKK